MDVFCHSNVGRRLQCVIVPICQCQSILSVRLVAHNTTKANSNADNTNIIRKKLERRTKTVSNSRPVLLINANNVIHLQTAQIGSEPRWAAPEFLS